jgi:hypothetical protein
LRFYKSKSLTYLWRATPCALSQAAVRLLDQVQLYDEWTALERQGTKPLPRQVFAASEALMGLRAWSFARSV